MKKYLKSAFIFALEAALLLTGAFAATVDRTEVCLPEVRVNFTENADLSALQTKDITAQLDGEPLNVKSLVPNEQGIFYVFLLDISGSIPGGHFSAAKNAIADVYAGLRKQDKMALIACGNSVTEVLSGGEAADKVSAALDSLKNDENTLLYAGIDKLVALAAAEKDLRVEAVVISDGADTGGGVTRDKLEKDMLSSGVAVNALCVDTAKQGDAAAIRKLVEETGGKFTLFAADKADTLLMGMAKNMQNYWSLVLTAQDSFSSQVEKTLKVNLGGVDTIEAKINSKDWLPDTVSPKITSAAYDAEANFIEIKFSEMVDGAEDAASYSLVTDSGEQLSVASVQKADGTTYRVYPAASLPQDQTVTLEVSGPKDVSPEANPMEKYSVVIWQAKTTDKFSIEQPLTALKSKLDMPVQTLFILVVACALAVAGIIVAIVFAGKKRNKKGLKNSVDMEGKDRAAKPHKKNKKVKSSAMFVFCEDDQDDTPLNPSKQKDKK